MERRSDKKDKRPQLTEKYPEQSHGKVKTAGTITVTEFPTPRLIDCRRQRYKTIHVSLSIRSIIVKYSLKKSS